MTQFNYSEQPQYGAGQGYDQGYNQGRQQQSNYGQQEGQYSQAGAAQSYYGSNDQPYQQYSQEQQPYGQSYGQQIYSQQQYGGPGPYGQAYQASGSGHQSNEVEGFKSNFDQPSTGYNPNGQYSGPNGPDGDRGFMGAVAGGAAGAFGGHKMGGHGILGGIGGAIAGSLLEDAAKKKHKEHKEQKQGRRDSSSSSGSSHKHSRAPSHGPAPPGNFHASSQHVRLEGHCTLVAECKDSSGHSRNSAIDLNNCFTNDNGRLFWARNGNFAASARQIHLTENGQFIEAELADCGGHWHHNRVWLNERITNDNGQLKMI